MTPTECKIIFVYGLMLIMFARAYMNRAKCLIRIGVHRVDVPAKCTMLRTYVYEHILCINRRMCRLSFS